MGTCSSWPLVTDYRPSYLCRRTGPVLLGNHGRPLLGGSVHATGRDLLRSDGTAGVCPVLAPPNCSGLFVEPDIRARIWVHRGIQAQGGAIHDSLAGYPPVDSCTQLPSRRHAGHGVIVSASPAWCRTGSHSAHLYGPGLEYGL